jgi:argininosuccinate lyase
MAEELGFEGIINNSMAAMADRDFVVETLQWAATAM